MSDPVYSAARAAAAAVDAFFARHLAAVAHGGGAEHASVLDSEAVAAIVDAAFWASLRREEGRATRVTLALVPPEGARGAPGGQDAAQPLRFEYPLPLAPDALARLAPAVERPGIHLGVWRDGDEVRVWGAAHALPDLSLVVEVVEPGLLVIKYRRGPEFGKYGNIAVLRGNQIQVLDEDSASLPDCPQLLAALLGFDTPSSWIESRNELVQLAISMRSHGRGGALLVVPRGTHRWRESMVRPILYAASPAYSSLAELTRRALAERGEVDWQDAVRRQVEVIAGLTAVDGVAVMTDAYELLAFGAKIGRRDGHPPIETVIVTEPVVGNVARVVSPSQLGGTRHLSAAQFVHDQRDALALVASQDGRFTVFAWSPCEESVHAHRIEALLL